MVVEVLVVNIPANVNELAEGAGSAGDKLSTGALQTRTDSAHPAMAARARPRATIRTVISSPCSPQRPTSST
jgi:phosphatidylethanolamine-binding protein (PEBP) family uncharacterized protein